MRFFFIFILLLSFNTQAQIPNYLIYAVKGDATVNKANALKQKAVQKLPLFAPDVLSLVANTELTLVDAFGKYLVLSTAGVYKVSELTKRLHIASFGQTKNYLTQFWNTITGTDKLAEPVKKASKMGGLATRGDDCNNGVFPVAGLITAQDSLHFIWHGVSTTATYTLQLFSDTGMIVQLPIADTQYVIAVKELQGGKTGKYFWQVTSKDFSCEAEIPTYLELVSKEKEKSLIESLMPTGKLENVLDELAFIDTLEKHALVYVAAEHYSALLKKYPDDTILLQNYTLFLTKYGFEKEAKRVWEKIEKTN